MQIDRCELIALLDFSYHADLPPPAPAYLLAYDQLVVERSLLVLRYEIAKRM
jgi:hypothetical protein